ncbi:HNH endonuclease [Paraburkholderia phenoliruptrix]|nr:HNH endonuclease [Paraburkholderia phenoliruptrix]
MRAVDAVPARRRGADLDVHHRTDLADRGEDTGENAIASCPNCHHEQLR